MEVVETGYRKTEVGIIPSDWHVYKQGNVVEFINGRAYSKDEWEKSGIPVVRLQNLTGSGDKYYYSNLNLPDKNYMHNGDLIFMWSASFGPHIWEGQKAIFHYHIWKVECGYSLINKIFYYYKLLELTEKLKKSTSGSTMLHLTKGDMEEFKISLPPLQEQKAIATALSDVDALIQKLDDLIEKKQNIKKATMQLLLTGKKRLEGFDNGAGYKMTEVGRIPSDWEIKRIDEVLTFGSGQDYKHLSSGDYPVYGTGGLMTFVDDYLYEGDSVGIGRKGTIDKPVFLSGRFWTVDTLFYTHSFTECIPKFIYYKFLTIQWKEYNEASGVPSLNKNTLGKITIAVPSFSEQKAIATALLDMDSEIGELAAKREKFKLIKQGMMQELLTGKTRLV